MDEKRRSSQFGEVRGPQLGRFARRMQRIRKQQEAWDQVRLLGREHGGLAAAIRMASKINFPADFRPQNLNRPAEALAIAGCGAGERGPMGPRLAKRKIATKYQETVLGKGSGGECQQF
jgi:hypothetical protein